MKNYRIKYVGSHDELSNHVPKTAAFIYHPTIGSIIKFGMLFFKVKDIIHIANDDIEYPFLIITYIENQPDL